MNLVVMSVSMRGPVGGYLVDWTLAREMPDCQPASPVRIWTLPAFIVMEACTRGTLNGRYTQIYSQGIHMQATIIANNEYLIVLLLYVEKSL